MNEQQRIEQLKAFRERNESFRSFTGKDMKYVMKESLWGLFAGQSISGSSGILLDWLYYDIENFDWEKLDE